MVQYIYEKPDWKKITPVLEEAAKTQLHNMGPVRWMRVDRYPHFRIEWRMDNGDLVYNFYHPQGPDPMLGFDDPHAVRINEKGHKVVDVHHGDNVALPPEFQPFLEKICDYLFTAHKNRSIDYVPDTLSFQLRVVGAARNPLAMEHYTHDFFEILHANITADISES